MRIDQKCYQALQISQDFFEENSTANLNTSAILPKFPFEMPEGGFNTLF